MRRVRGLGLVVIVSIFASACSDTPLRELGGRSSDWIGEVRHSTTAPTVLDLPGETPTLVGATADVEWWNMELAPTSLVEEEVALAAVIARRPGSDRFVQASPYEIASTVPDLRFPAELPVGVTSITSQLVLAPDADALGDTQVAAFGLWAVEPYSRSRSSGQTGTLFVSRAVDDACPQPEACDLFMVGDLEVSRSLTRDEVTLAWNDERLGYELTMRGQPTEMVVEIVRTFEPLGELLTGRPLRAEAANGAGLAGIPRSEG